MSAQFKSKSEETLVKKNARVEIVKFANEKERKNKTKKIDDAKAKECREFLAKMPLTKSTTCGFWIFRGKFFQRFANQTAYVVIAGIVGCIFNSTFSYFNGTMTTIEKRFKIPSRNSGIIYVGYDTATLLIAGVLCYYAGKGHRPRWIGFGLVTIFIACILMALPHFIYGPGENALALTLEMGNTEAGNATKALIEQKKAESLCYEKPTKGCIEEEEGSFTPQIIFYMGQFVAGIGGSLFDSIGSTYMDDNTEKAKAPVMLSICFFLRMLGPATGYVLASYCLRLYISTSLKPAIPNDDPRWLGAWWLGWLIIGGLLAVFGVFLAMFPKQLPLALARRILENESKKSKAQQLKLETINEEDLENSSSLLAVDSMQQKIADVEALDTKATIKDMVKTFRELIKNKTFMYNNWSSAFFCFGYTPYWVFTAKYIELQYRQSASTSSMVTGVAGFAFSAIGVLSAGVFISSYKPSARQMAGWNMMVTLLTCLGLVSYAFVGCDLNDKTMVVNIPDGNTATCNSACDCDYVEYSPVCGENGLTFISPCHAGCTTRFQKADEKQIYTNCACISKLPILNESKFDFDQLSGNSSINGGQAISGACPVDCFTQFVIFVAIMSTLKFIGATAQASTFLLNVRCVPEKDKTTSVGFGMMMMCFLVFIPGPIFFGWIFDCMCLVWGKTCSSEGNCWLYDAKLMRYVLNFTAASFIFIGCFFDIGVFRRVRDLKLFDEEDVTENEMEVLKIEKEFISRRKRNSF